MIKFNEYEEENWNEFIELKKKIQKAGFKEEKFQYIDPRDKKEYKHDAFNIIKIHSAYDKKIKQKDDDKIPKHIQTLNHLKRIDSFFNEYANILLIHTRLMQPGAKKLLTDIQKKYKKDILKKEGQYLKSRGYSKRTINSTLTLLEKDLDKKIVNYLNTKAGKGTVYPNDKHETRQWLVQENYTISKIKSLYEEFTELSERQIQLNMALVFEKINFWPHEREGTKGKRLDRYFEKIKKRYQSIKNRPFAFELYENSKENLL